jgi:Mn-containing catalase
VAAATCATSQSAAEIQGRLQTARRNMTDDNGVRNMLRFNLAGTLHQNLWLRGDRGYRPTG